MVFKSSPWTDTLGTMGAGILIGAGFAWWESGGDFALGLSITGAIMLALAATFELADLK